MAQPVKKNNSPNNDLFSKELSTLLAYCVENFMRVYGSNVITAEVFVYMALEYPNSLLYKVVNMLIPKEDIDVLHDEVEGIVEYSNGVIGGKMDNVFRDPLFKSIVENAANERDVTESKLINSDHVLLAILRSDKLQDLCSILKSHDITYKNLVPKIKALHGITDQVFKVIQTTGGQFSSDNGKKKNTKVSYCRNINNEIDGGFLTRTIGFKNETDRIFTILARKNNNNVLIVGEKGVGKTQCAYGVAETIMARQSPIPFQGKTMWCLNSTELFAGTAVRGSVESRIVDLKNELIAGNGDIFLIDDMYALFGDRHSSGEVDTASMFASIFRNPKIRVVACATPKDIKKINDSYPDLLKGFQEVNIEKISVDKCVDLLSNIACEYEKFHNVKYSDEVLYNITRLADTHITDKMLPLSAIDIMDEIGANKNIFSDISKKYMELESDITVLKVKIGDLYRKDDIEGAQEVEEEIDKKRNELSRLVDLNNTNRYRITVEDVYEIFSKHTGIPVSQLTKSEKERLRNVEETFNKKIIGQQKAIHEVAMAIKRNMVGLTKKALPRLATMAIGQSGVGKTLLAKVLAKDVLGDEKYLVRFDMSEYADETAVNKLIGSSAGYVGYSDGGLLTEAVKRNKYCVLLIDEIEKAHPKVFNLFLQILDEGFITDNKGDKVRFNNTYIIMTSNIGARQALEHKTVGYSTGGSNDKEEIIRKELKNKFPPEFINRFDSIIFFNNLTEDNLKNIIGLELSYLKEQLSTIGHSMEYTEDVLCYIRNSIKSEAEYGARPIKRVIKNEIENCIADIIINEDMQGHTFNVSVEEGKIKVE